MNIERCKPGGFRRTTAGVASCSEFAAARLSDLLRSLAQQQARAPQPTEPRILKPIPKEPNFPSHRKPDEQAIRADHHQSESGGAGQVVCGPRHLENDDAGQQ
jgi:hypothetical protein